MSNIRFFLVLAGWICRDVLTAQAALKESEVRLIDVVVAVEVLIRAIAIVRKQSRVGRKAGGEIAKLSRRKEKTSCSHQQGYESQVQVHHIRNLTYPISLPPGVGIC